MDHKMMGHDMGMKSADDGSKGMSGDMGNMSMNSTYMMKMWFHTGLNEYLLFKPWFITSAGEMVAACFGVFILAALYEGLKILREYMLTRNMKAIGKNDYHMANNNLTTGSDGDVHVRRARTSRLSILSCGHVLQTFLHMIQVLVSYFLMLIFMTYNIWLCLAVILGAGAGYFAFSWKRTVLLEDLTEHCH